jgi:hypothetical protein
MEGRLYDHPHASCAMAHLAEGNDGGFRRNAQAVAARVRAPAESVCDVLRAIDVLDGLFAPLLGYDGKPRRPIQNRRVPNRKARS